MVRLLSLSAVGLLALLSTTPADAQAKKNPIVIMETSAGTLKIELLPEKSKDMVAQFLSYANNNFYDGTIFHSVLADRVEGGQYMPDLKRKPTRPPSSSHDYNGVPAKRGTIAMVKWGDDGEVISQFMINLADNKQYDKVNNVSSCVFGQVVEGLEILDKIKAVKTMAKGELKSTPARPIIVKSVRLQK